MFGLVKLMRLATLKSLDSSQMLFDFFVSLINSQKKKSFQGKIIHYIEGAA